MAGPLIDPDELVDYWRPLTDAEQIVAESLVIVASAIIRRRVPDIDARIADGTLDPVIVGYVVSEMVKGAIEAGSRPVDAKQVSDTVGPYTRAVTFAAASARIALTDDLLGLLTSVTAESSGIGSIRLRPALIPRVCPPEYPAVGRRWT